tara:strand:- start:458 stop:1042 length:585 start_codon:yes stop_codon:yes gene_type:complete
MVDKLIIVDVGAMKFPSDSYGFKENEDLENLEIHLFEPIPNEYNKLVKQYGKDKRYKIYNTALYDKKIKTNFYKTGKAECSSLFEPSNKGGKYAYKSFEVETDTLDNILGDINHIDYLKLDTQGSEFEILCGATEILKKTKNIKCEVGYIHMYKNQKLAEDVKMLLESKGFELTKKRWENPGRFNDYYFVNKHL